MNKFLTFVYSLTSIGLAALIILSFDQFKLVPTLIVCLFTFAINYSIYKYNKEMAVKKYNIQKNESINQSSLPLGRIFSLIAVLLISLQLFFYYDLINSEYQESFGLIALLIMIALGIILIRKIEFNLKSKKPKQSDKNKNL